MIQYDRAIWDPVDRKAVETRMPAFLCASVAGDHESFVVRDRSGGALQRYRDPLRLARSHYLASHGQESCWGECGSAVTGVVFSDIYRGITREVRIYGDAGRVADGPFYRNSGVRISAVTDGMSSTIFFGEHSLSLSDKTWVGVIPGAFIHPRFRSPENGPDASATMVLVHAGPSGGARYFKRTDHSFGQFSDVPRGSNVCRSPRRRNRMYGGWFSSVCSGNSGFISLGRIVEHERSRGESS